MRGFTWSANLMEDYRITNLPLTPPDAQIGPLAALHCTPLRITFDGNVGASACAKMFLPTNSPANCDPELSANIQRALMGNQQDQTNDSVIKWVAVTVSINHNGLRVTFANPETRQHCEYRLQPSTRKNQQDIQLLIEGPGGVCRYHEYFALGQRLVTLVEPLDSTKDAYRRLTFCAPIGINNLPAILVNEYRL